MRHWDWASGAWGWRLVEGSAWVEGGPGGRGPEQGDGLGKGSPGKPGQWAEWRGVCQRCDPRWAWEGQGGPRCLTWPMVPQQPQLPSQRPSELEALQLVCSDDPSGAEAAGQLLFSEGSPSTCSCAEDSGQRTTEDSVGVLCDSAPCVPLREERRQPFSSKLPIRKAAAGLGSSSRRGARAVCLCQASPSKEALDEQGPAGSTPKGAMGRKTQGLLSEFCSGPTPFPPGTDLPPLGRGGQGALALRGSRLPRPCARKKPVVGSTRENAMQAQDDATRNKQPHSEEEQVSRPPSCPAPWAFSPRPHNCP